MYLSPNLALAGSLTNSTFYLIEELALLSKSNKSLKNCSDPYLIFLLFSSLILNKSVLPFYATGSGISHS